jgi:hypothetical protein
MNKRFAVWGALLVVIAVLSIETGGAPLRYLRSPLGLVLVAGAVAYAIFAGGRGKKKAAPALDGLPAVNQILRIAREHKGRITAAEVLAQTSLELEDVKKTLDELAYAGTCQLLIGEKGTQVYYFAEFESAAAKGTDVLDTAAEPSAAQKQAAQKKDHA